MLGKAKLITVSCNCAIERNGRNVPVQEKHLSLTLFSDNEFKIIYSVYGTNSGNEVVIFKQP